jgi:hypothetical protein
MQTMQTAYLKDGKIRWGWGETVADLQEDEELIAEEIVQGFHRVRLAPIEDPAQRIERMKRIEALVDAKLRAMGKRRN